MTPGEPDAVQWPAEKRCTKCGQVKPVEAFGMSRAGRSRLLRPRPSCKACRVEAEKARYLIDPAPNKARAAAWYVRNRERGIANAKASAAANPERTRAAKDRYSAAHPEVRRATVQRRRVRLKAGVIENFRDLEIFERDGWTCQLCGGTIDPALRAPHQGSKSLDHIVPVSKGGSHTRDNVQAAHLRCNQIKSARVDHMPPEYRP